MKQRLIDANKIPNCKYKVAARAGDKESLCEFRVAHWKDIEEMPTVDPETLPIVQELREQLKRVAQERDAAVEQLRGCAIENCAECMYCLYNTAKSFCGNCQDGSNWRYRGFQGDAK